jgi:hypothetical protein
MKETPMKRSIFAASVVGATLLMPLTAAAAGSGGVTGAAFYVDGELYRTVGTPSDLSGTGAPAHSFDTLYDIGGQMNVATAAPGDAGYNGGRWRVRAVDIPDYDAALAAADGNGSGDLDSDEEVELAVQLGVAEFGDIVASFVCPVIPLP